MTFEEYLGRASVARNGKEICDLIDMFRYKGLGCYASSVPETLNIHFPPNLVNGFLDVARGFSKNDLGALLLVGALLYLNRVAEEGS